MFFFWAAGRASDLSRVRCKWFAYGPADATVTPSSLAPVMTRMVYLSGASLPRFCIEKRPLNGCSVAVVWTFDVFLYKQSGIVTYWSTCGGFTAQTTNWIGGIMIEIPTRSQGIWCGLETGSPCINVRWVCNWNECACRSVATLQAPMWVVPVRAVVIVSWSTDCTPHQLRPGQ